MAASFQIRIVQTPAATAAAAIVVYSLEARRNVNAVSLASICA